MDQIHRSRHTIERILAGRRWSHWVLLFAGSTVMGLLFAVQNYVTPMEGEEAINWGIYLVNFLTLWYLWALLYPLIAWLGRKFPLGRGDWNRNLTVHIPALIIIPIFHLGVYVTVLHSLGTLGDMTWSESIEYLLRRGLAFRFLTYGFILALTHSLDYYRQYRERELRATQMEARLAEARLQVLKMQLQPHFLFNTLHAISSLMHKDVEAADEMITRLGDLLRLTLESDGVQEVTLRQEIEFLHHYLEIEKIRLGDRLRVEMNVEAELYDALVPNLILQPIVENAIRHGISQRTSGGRILVVAKRAGQKLDLSVIDDGPGLPPQPTERIGLRNTRIRLEQLYGTSQSFSIVNDPNGGVSVTLQFPVRFDSTPAVLL